MHGVCDRLPVDRHFDACVHASLEAGLFILGCALRDEADDKEFVLTILD